MTLEEFDAKQREWEKRIESVLIEMSDVYDSKGLLLHSEVIPIADAFIAESARLRKAMRNGVVRCGMKVYDK